MATRLPRAKSKPHPGRPLDGSLAQQKGRRPRYLVRIERHAPRPLDDDNLAGSCKALVDCLGQAGTIPDDAPDICEIEAVNVKSKRSDQGTRLFVYDRAPAGGELSPCHSAPIITLKTDAVCSACLRQVTQPITSTQ